MKQHTASILIVDDELDMQFMLKTSFHDDILAEKYLFQFASNGREALEVLESHPEIMVVVSDIIMPHLDGLELLDELRIHYPLVCPIIITAFNTMPYVRLAMNRGAFDFLEKPFNREDFSITLEKALQHVTVMRQNIEKRQQAEDALKRSKQQYRMLVERVGDGIAIFQGKRIVFVNEALCAMLGEDAATLRRKTPNFLLDERRAVRTIPEHSCLKHFRYNARDGRELWLEHRKSTIQWEGEEALLITLRDISAHKVHELALESETRQLRRENLALKGVISTHERFGDLVGRSPAMQQVYEMTLRAADNDRPVLIYGESGTGKELVARTIWQIGPRNEGQFVPVNCGAIPENLFESEIFGYCKGAFTGANTDKPGLFTRAHKGTLFLDEIGELSAASQVKLLRVLESGEYTPVGGTSVKRSNARIIAATHRKLTELVETGEFREDLFYRLHVNDITVPPLRARKDDLPLLIDFFLERLSGTEQQNHLPANVVTRLCNHHWPGNIRELQNVLHRYVSTGALIFAGRQKVAEKQAPFSAFHEFDGRPLSQIVEHVEKNVITNALEQEGWHRAKTAKILGMTVRHLHRKITKYHILQTDKHQSST